MNSAELSVTYHAAQARKETQARDKAIRAAIKRGMSLRDLASAAGLSHTAIAQIRDR